MLKILKDVLLKYDGQEYQAKEGETVDLKKVFDLEGRVKELTEMRYADKFKQVIITVAEVKEIKEVKEVKPKVVTKGAKNVSK